MLKGIKQVAAEGNQWREHRLVEYKQQVPDKTAVLPISGPDVIVELRRLVTPRNQRREA